MVKEATTCRIAVAYCGGEAHRFLPEKPAERPQDLRIVVDASPTAVGRGLTNPKGLRRLLGMPCQLRSLQALHAKVLIFDNRAALVGSTNMSENSLNQHQLGLEIRDPSVIRQLVEWFEKRIWTPAIPVASKTIRNLAHLWPICPFMEPSQRTKARLPRWRGEPPEPAPGPSEFKLAITKPELRHLLDQFRKKECPYTSNGETCAAHARRNEAKYNNLGRELHSLWRRRNSWTKKQLEELFMLAYTNGRAAIIRKPAFIRQNPKRVASSLAFLLQGAGDPYVRFEKVLAKGSPYKLNSLGEVGVICLMHMWEPKEFALIAEPVDKALKTLIDFGRPVSLRRGQGYKDRTEAAKAIAKITGLKTLGRVDHFLDAIGKRHIGRRGPRRVRSI